MDSIKGSFSLAIFGILLLLLGPWGAFASQDSDSLSRVGENKKRVPLPEEEKGPIFEDDEGEKKKEPEKKQEKQEEEKGPIFEDDEGEKKKPEKKLLPSKKASKAPDKKPWRKFLPFDLQGFFEIRSGVLIRKDEHHSKNSTLAESRLQLEGSKTLDWTEFRVKSDFLYDGVTEKIEVDLREASALLSPLEFMDLKIGRQILTWGTGEYIFINDLFPKDWKSFFVGRAMEYLKAPSNALKISLYSSYVNVDLVYAPLFNPDRFIDGERLTYYNPQTGSLVGEEQKIHPIYRSRWFREDEMAFRIYRNTGGIEMALYGYRGFFKTPSGFNPQQNKAYFPRLSVYGASVRGSFLGGIGNIEGGYYHSQKDSSGDNPFVQNSQFRLLLGYKRELARDLRMGVQYYMEYRMDYGPYKKSLPPGVPKQLEYYHLLTFSVSKQALRQNLRLSLFVFYSPSEQDIYLRPQFRYSITDRWFFEGGASIFFRREKHTFFGQFSTSSNVYIGIRWNPF